MWQRARQVSTMVALQEGMQRDHTTLIYIFLGSSSTMSSLALQLLKITVLNEWLALSLNS